MPTVSTRYDGTIHDFGLLNALADLPTTKAMIRQVSEGIREHIGQKDRSERGKNTARLSPSPRQP